MTGTATGTNQKQPSAIVARFGENGSHGFNVLI
jgi:hypothetical protein